MLKLVNAVVLLGLTFLAIVNTLQIQRLNGQIEGLQTRLQNAENRAQAEKTLSLQDAVALLAQAREAVQNTDWQKARRLTEQATQQAGEISRFAGQHAGPTLDWVQKQAQTLKAEIDKASH